jgi:hypothetical protein
VQQAAAAQQHEAVVALYKQAFEYGKQVRLLSSLATETYTCFMAAATAVSSLLAVQLLPVCIQVVVSSSSARLMLYAKHFNVYLDEGCARFTSQRVFA